MYTSICLLVWHVILNILRYAAAIWGLSSVSLYWCKGIQEPESMCFIHALSSRLRREVKRASTVQEGRSSTYLLPTGHSQSPSPYGSYLTRLRAWCNTQWHVGFSRWTSHSEVFWKVKIHPLVTPKSFRICEIWGRSTSGFASRPKSWLKTPLPISTQLALADVRHWLSTSFSSWQREMSWLRQLATCKWLSWCLVLLYSWPGS